MINPDAIKANKGNKDIAKSSYLKPRIKTIDDMIEYGMFKLGYPLQTVELT